MTSSCFFVPFIMESAFPKWLFHSLIIFECKHSKLSVIEVQCHVKTLSCPHESCNLGTQALPNKQTEKCELYCDGVWKEGYMKDVDVLKNQVGYPKELRAGLKSKGWDVRKQDNLGVSWCIRTGWQVQPIQKSWDWRSKWMMLLWRRSGQGREEPDGGDLV